MFEIRLQQVDRVPALFASPGAISVEVDSISLKLQPPKDNGGAKVDSCIQEKHPKTSRRQPLEREPLETTARIKARHPFS